jgi:acetyl-CoA carboxylase carboxyl transferase subunit beta
MSIVDWFAKKEKRKLASQKLNIPGDLWVKCQGCSEVLFLKDLEQSLKVCPKCNYHFRITAEERIKFTFDEGSFEEIDTQIGPIDFLNFEDTETYKDRIARAQKKSGVKDAIRTGTALIKGKAVNVAIMDFGFMGGSMGSVVGEKITRVIELALENKNPVVIFTASGGARMQEGILSLMQMAKTSAALYLLGEAHIPFISVVCDPTTGGTSASFAMLGDINITEPGTLISFAGPRVIEQTIRQKLPKGFQRAEFLLEHGMVDKVVSRSEMRNTLSTLLCILDPRGNEDQ